VTTEPDTPDLLPEGVAQPDLDQLVAPALELALVVARLCGQLRPPVPVPRSLRAMARFAKLPASARPAVRKVLEGDEEFRARVAAAAKEVGLPGASLAFVTRPEGWQEVLAEELARAQREQAAAASERTDRALQRRLDGAESAVLRLQEAVTAGRMEIARSTDELADERRARREAEERAGAAARRLSSVEGERDSARRKAEDGTAAADALRVERDQLRTERDALRIERDQLQGERDRLRAEHQRGAAREGAVVPAVVVAPVVGPTPEVGRGALPGRQAAAGAIAAAAAAAESLGRALAAAADALQVDPAALPTPGPVAIPSLPTLRDGSVRREQAPVRRRPQPLPPAVFDDSIEAAEHLVRVQGMLVLVDGYNVTLSTWQDLPISTQRARLVDACGELAARVGAEVLIIFDGAEEPGDLPSPMGRGRVRWRFSPPGVEADDVLLDMVGSIETERPVMVASSDRRVRDGARSLGANAISTPQLLALLRRDARRRD